MIRGEPFQIIPPLVEIYRDKSPEVVITKAAQVFISEYCVNLALWCADTKAGKRGNALYVFPSAQAIGDFTRARVDTAVEESDYLIRRVRPVKGLAPVGKAADNVGLKRVGKGFIYFRGSNSESGLLTVDADVVIYDEVDRLREGTLALGQKRLGSSLLGWQRYASTPKFPEVGVDALWLQSDRRRYHLRCEHCSKWQYLQFPDNVLEGGTVVCSMCQKPIDRLVSGEWVAESPGRDIKGYHMTKLVSPRADIAALAKIGYGILRREITDQSSVQEFYNQDLGIAHAPEGGQLSRAEIQSCIAEYSLDEWAPKGCTMGVDVGARLHVVITAPSPSETTKQRLAFAGAVTWDDLPLLMRRFDVKRCVIDGQPETQKAREFANKFPGRVFLAYYPDPATWSHKEPCVWKREERVVQAHRTITLDGMFAEVRERRIEYPREILALPEFAAHMMAPVRVIEKSAGGLMVGKYLEGGKADHGAHAANYCYIARLFGGGVPFGHVRLDA